MAVETKVIISAQDKSAGAFASVGRNLSGLNSTVRRALGAVAGLAGVYGLGAMLKSSFANVDGLAKLSDRLGIATESMAGLQHAADLAGVSGQTLNTGLRTMLKNVGEAAQGFGVATRAFDVLGLSAQKLSALAPDLQLQKILDTLAGVENVTLRNATASQIFGVRASEMLNLIADGAGGVRRATEDTIAWGKALDRVDSAKIEHANDAVDRARTAIEGLVNRVAVQLAPVITSLATGFADSAKESKGFADETTSGMEKVTLAVAYSANAVHGLQVTYAGLKVAIAEVLDFTIRAFVQTQDFFDKLPIFRAARVLSEKLHGLSTQQAVNLEELVTVSANRLEELKTEFDMLLLEPLPADAVIAWFAKVKAEAQKAAEETAAARKKLFGTGGEIVEPRKREDKDRDDFFKYEEGLNKKLAALDLYLMSDTQKLEAAFAQRGETLQELYSLDLLSQQEFFDRSAELTLQHQAAMGDIESQGILARREFERRNMTQRIQDVSGLMLQLTNSVATHSKALFQINKVAGIANAIVNAHEGASKTLAKYPWPLAQILAGLHYAAGFAQVQAIRSASFGGSTSAPSIGGGGAIPVTDVGAPAPAAAPAPRPQVIYVNIPQYTGVVDLRAWVMNNFLPTWNEVVGDGANVTIVPR